MLDRMPHAASSSGDGGSTQLESCTASSSKLVVTSLRRPSIGTALVIGDGGNEHLADFVAHTELAHLEHRHVKSRDATPTRIRDLLDSLSAPLIYLEIRDSEASGRLLRLLPPSRHRPVAVVTRGNDDERLRAQLRHAGYIHQCRVGEWIARTSYCPIPATELLFNSMVGALLRDGLLREGSLLDAGANNGAFACWYASLDPRRPVHALDPSPRHVQAIRSEFAARQPNLQAEVRGLGGATGLVMRRGGRASTARDDGGRSAVELCEGRDRGLPSVSSVTRGSAFAVCRVDDLYSRQPLAFAHWDVEGEELNVLRGAHSVLLRDRPYFSVELHVHEDRAYTQRLLSQIESLGYDAHLVEERCGARADCRNLLCAPTEQRRRLARSAAVRNAVASGWLVRVNRSSIIERAYPCCAAGGACPSCSPSEVDRWLDERVRQRVDGGPDPRALHTRVPWDRTTPVSVMDQWAAEYSLKGGNRLKGEMRAQLPQQMQSLPGCDVDAHAASRLFKGLPTKRPSVDWMPILFLHITDATRLRPIEECAIQSAARLNPRFQVLLVSNSLQSSEHAGGNNDGFPLYPRDPAMASLPFPPRCVRLQYEAALAGTPLERWYAAHGHNASNPRLNVILADVLRMALLYKIGGAYLDLDLISIAPLPSGSLAHSIGMQQHRKATREGHRTAWQLNNAALLFRCPRSAILQALMVAFAQKYEPSVWGTGGPMLYTRVWRAWQQTRSSDANAGAQTAAMANLTVLPPATFYPLHWWQRRYFDEAQEGSESSVEAAIEPGVTVGVHLWSSVSGTRLHAKSAVADFVGQQCGFAVSDLSQISRTPHALTA